MAISRLNAMLPTRAGPPPSIAFVVFPANEDFALSGVIGRADAALLLHSLHDGGGAVVSDLQPALDVARGGLAVTQHDLDSLLVKLGGFAALAHAGGVEQRAVLFFLLIGGDRVEVVRGALGLEMAHDILDLLVGDERPMHAADAAAAGHVQHVALAEQLLGALPAENRAAVDLGGHLERDA